MRLRANKSWPFEALPPSDWSTQKPTYSQANPALIRAAVSRAQRRPSGNWFAFAASFGHVVPPPFEGCALPV